MKVRSTRWPHYNPRGAELRAGQRVLCRYGSGPPAERTIERVERGDFGSGWCVLLAPLPPCECCGRPYTADDARGVRGWIDASYVLPPRDERGAR